jgi:hypothetical protein
LAACQFNNALYSQVEVFGFSRTNISPEGVTNFEGTYVKRIDWDLWVKESCSKALSTTVKRWGTGSEFFALKEAMSSLFGSPHLT